MNAHAISFLTIGAGSTRKVVEINSGFWEAKGADYLSLPLVSDHVLNHGVGGQRGWQGRQPRTPQNGRIRTLAQNLAKMSIVGLWVAIWWC